MHISASIAKKNKVLFIVQAFSTRHGSVGSYFELVPAAGILVFHLQFTRGHSTNELMSAFELQAEYAMAIGNNARSAAFCVSPLFGRSKFMPSPG
jgi:hypothetical protein